MKTKDASICFIVFIHIHKNNLKNQAQTKQKIETAVF